MIWPSWTQQLESNKDWSLTSKTERMKTNLSNSFLIIDSFLLEYLKDGHSKSLKRIDTYLDTTR